ncbi:hypothetical protein ACF0H5_012873 [Mactra antiquata]
MLHKVVIKHRQYKVPYITAVVGIILLLVAVIVPITFLFVRKCSICSNIPDKQQTDIAQVLKYGFQSLV